MSANPATVIERLHRAWNARDPESMAACFHTDYQSIHPCHPERNFRGRKSVQLSWAAIFESIPDFKAELCRQAVAGDVVWTEWRWQGTHLNGALFEALGVMIFTIVDDQITQARVYSETLQTVGPDWDQVLEEVLACKPEEKSQ
ncbi:MAG: nuclear transport factor 2 family protein [Chloroflexota bacterium]